LNETFVRNSEDLKYAGVHLSNSTAFEVKLNWCKKKLKCQVFLSYSLKQGVGKLTPVGKIRPTVTFCMALEVVFWSKNEVRQSCLVVSELDSQLKDCGFKFRLIQNTCWKWGQSHARIDSCTQFWLIVKKLRNIQLAKRDTPKKNIFKMYLLILFE